MNRYLLATLIAGLISATALLYGGSVRQEFDQRLRESFRQAKVAGESSLENVDTMTMELSDFGIEVSNREIRKYRLSRVIEGAWFVWGPFVLALCLGAAYLWPNPGKLHVVGQRADEPGCERP
jgi:hypothetical protein